MKGIKKFIYGALTAALLGLAACGPIQAKEGQIYMAGLDGAKVTTVLDMKRLFSCSVPPNTFALGERITYFAEYLGDQEWDVTPLTEVVHTGQGCSSPGGLYDFIKGKPENAGWTPIEDPEALKQAEASICEKPELRDKNPLLDKACNGWGIER